MNLFKRITSLFKKKSLTAQISSIWEKIDPDWSPKDYRAFTQEGYKKVVWVYACVREIATSVSNLKWQLLKNNDTVIENHPILDLLHKPNPWTSGQEFLENWATYLTLSGNAYWGLDAVDNNGRPKELRLLRPDRIQILPSAEDFIKGYVYIINDKKVFLDKNEIIHFKYIDPLDEYYGMSPLEAGARTVDVENEAVDWNKVFFQNAARPDGALVTEDELSDEQFERLEKQIREDWQGGKNAHKPLLLESGLKWVQMSLAQKDMDFLSLRKLSREEICAIFGVPPVLVGILDRATYSNYEQARRSFYEETIIPLLNKLVSKINSELIPRYGEDITLDYDLSHITSLQENKDSVYNRLSTGISQGFITINEARKELGYEPTPWGDDWWASLNLYPVTSKPSNKNHSQYEKKLLPINLKPDMRKQYWEDFDGKRRRWEKKVSDEVKNIFKQEEKDVLESLNNNKNIDDLVINWQKNWRNVLIATYATVMEDFGKETIENIQKNIPGGSEKKWEFDVWAEGVQSWIASVVGAKVKGITDTTLRFLKLEIETGMKEGETIPEIALRVQNLWDMFSERRSIVIARTEVISASNAGSFFGAKQTGLPLQKEWLATQDKRVRDTHKKVDGQIREMDEPFNIGRGKLMFPGDSSLGAPKEETIQCRCTQVYVVK